MYKYWLHHAIMIRCVRYILHELVGLPVMRVFTKVSPFSNWMSHLPLIV